MKTAVIDPSASASASPNLDVGQDGLRNLLRAGFAAKIWRQDAIGERLVNRRLYCMCGRAAAKTIVAHHRDRKDRSVRISDALARDVGRTSMGRLIEPPLRTAPLFPTSGSVADGNMPSPPATAATRSDIRSPNKLSAIRTSNLRGLIATAKGASSINKCSSWTSGYSSRPMRVTVSLQSFLSPRR